MCLTGHVPFLLQLGERGGQQRGRWVMVTQITPHLTAYLHLTPNNTANGTAAAETVLIQQASRFRHIISGNVTCPPDRSCDLVVRTNRVAEFVLVRAKGREEKKKIIFPFAIFNLATQKVVVSNRILRYIKVISLFNSSPTE